MLSQYWFIIFRSDTGRLFWQTIIKWPHDDMVGGGVLCTDQNDQSDATPPLTRVALA